MQIQRLTRLFILSWPASTACILPAYQAHSSVSVLRCFQVFYARFWLSIRSALHRLHDLIQSSNLSPLIIFLRYHLWWSVDGSRDVIKLMSHSLLQCQTLRGFVKWQAGLVQVDPFTAGLMFTLVPLLTGSDLLTKSVFMTRWYLMYEVNPGWLGSIRGEEGPLCNVHDCIRREGQYLQYVCKLPWSWLQTGAKNYTNSKRFITSWSTSL